MKQCPKCSRTYANDKQKFCTKDGTALVDAHNPAAGQDTTIRIDSAQLDDEITKVISQPLPRMSSEGPFDPYKTNVSTPSEPTPTPPPAPPPAQPAAPPTIDPYKTTVSTFQEVDASPVAMKSEPVAASAPPPTAPAPPAAPPSQPGPPPAQSAAPPPATAPPTIDPYKTTVSTFQELDASPAPMKSEPVAPPPEPVKPRLSDTVAAPASIAPQVVTPTPTPPAATSPARSSASQAATERPVATSSASPIAPVNAATVQVPSAVTAAPVAAPAATAPPAPVAAVRKRSKLPIILGGLFILLLVGAGGAVAGYFFLVKPMLEKKRLSLLEPQRPEPTPMAVSTPDIGEPKPQTPKIEVPPYSPPADAVQFVNSSTSLDGKLAEHYVDFSFYYPNTWQKDPKAGVHGASNFAKVERRLPPDFTQENFAVGWYASTGSEEGDRAIFPTLAQNLSAQFAKGFSEYKKVSEGPTKAGVYDGYEFRFESASRDTARGDLKIWGRVIFVPPVDGSKNGVSLLMLTTSLARELKSIDDVGVKGELPMMLASFRFGRP